jgi:hypothetical protein
VTKDGRPLPVEYLMVDVPVGAPKTPEQSLAGAHLEFPIGNRNLVAADQLV